MHERVESEAADWALRHPLARAEAAALERWLARDPAHRGALLRAQAALSCVDRALALSGPGTRVQSRPVPRRNALIGLASAAVAASVAALVGWPLLDRERVVTAPGEIRRLPLADGSIATIDTDSELRVTLARDDRRVALSRGQAWFQVAKDRRRPFVVDAGIAQVRAVGTAFAVHRTADEVQVVVTEGTVAIWPTEASGAMSLLRAGQYATFSRGGTALRTGTAPAAVGRSLAWRDGEIALEGDTLASAVARFNRYNRQQLELVDADLAGERLVGLFKVDEVAAFAAMLEATLDVSATSTPDLIRLSRRKNVDPVTENPPAAARRAM